MNKKYIIAGLVIIALLAVIVFIAPKNNPEETDKVKVVASFYPLYFFAQQIGGDKVEVTNITPPGTEPHEYEVTPQDIVTMQNSRLLILNGVNLETWSENIQQNITIESTTIIQTSNELANKEVVEEGETMRDPHVWLSPPLANEIAEKITQALLQVDPENKEYYELNFKLLKEKLIELDNSYNHGLSNCTKKDIVTSHEAFGYLADEYELTQVAISGVSTEEEPSPQQLIELAKFVRNNDIEYIFFESLISPELSETLARETGAKTLELNPIEGLDAEQLANGEDYFTKMQDNLTNLKIALKCSNAN